LRIFEISAEQVERLDERQLVEVIRNLIRADLQKSGIPLRSGSTPAQIHIPDGGEDGRVSWRGGPNETDFIPSRYTVFQCKRTDPQNAGAKKETWKKGTGTATKPAEINDALSLALKNSGAYIVATTSPIVGTKIDERKGAVRKGISEAGQDPSLLSSIDFYDANKISLWINSHPSIALSLNAKLRDVHLHGFLDFDTWSKEADITEIPLQETKEPRYKVRGATLAVLKKEYPDIDALHNLKSISGIISNFLRSKGKAIRVFGASGFGKTRFTHTLLLNIDDDFEETEQQIVYVTFPDASDRIVNIARDISSSGSNCILVVDDCPDDIHYRLSEIVNRPESKCKLITINVEAKLQDTTKCLGIELAAAPDEIINGIINSIMPEVVRQNGSIIRDLSKGFPRMAVLAARAFSSGDITLATVDNVMERIVWGDTLPEKAALRTLRTLSLFTVIGVEHEAASELVEIAAFLGRPVGELFEEIKRFEGRGVIRRTGDYAEVQPVPLAIRLANDWWQNAPAGTMEEFCKALSTDLQLRMIAQLRWLSWFDETPRFAERLMLELVPDETALNSELGSKFMDRLVHLAPDAVMAHLVGLLNDKTIDELSEFRNGRRHVVWALEKLAFREATFKPAARLLLRLGAAENESWGNNATGEFTSLYQLHLSGTEAPPQSKIAVLDEALSSGDTRVRHLGVDALNNMLRTGHFSRSGGREYIGAGPALEDWQATTYGEIFDYYRAALARLEVIASNPNDPFKDTALTFIDNHIRSLLRVSNLIDEVLALISRLRDQYPDWLDPIQAVNSWLYFDSQEAPTEDDVKIRQYYNTILPQDDMELLALYSSGWGMDFHDPSSPYDKEGDSDHHFAERESKRIIADQPKSAEHFRALVDRFLNGDYKTGGTTVFEIAKHVDSPIDLVEAILEHDIDEEKYGHFGNLVRAAIAGANKTSEDDGRSCLRRALEDDRLKAFTLDFIVSVKLDNDLFNEGISAIEANLVAPWKVGNVAFSVAIDDISLENIGMLVHAVGQKGEEGAWAALDFLANYFHSRRIGNQMQASWVLEALTSGFLHGRERYQNSDGYHWRELAQKLIEAGFLDIEAATTLLTFMLEVTNADEYMVQLNMDEYYRTILREIARAFPGLVWNTYHAWRESADLLHKHRLSGLFDADGDDPINPGVLNEISATIYIPWMLEDRAARVPFILDWIHLLERNEKGVMSWSPEFLEFIETHICNADEMNMLNHRFTTGTWVGSYANKLELQLEYIEQLRHIQNPNVREWAGATSASLRERIKEERRQDANRSISYRT